MCNEWLDSADLNLHFSLIQLIRIYDPLGKDLDNEFTFQFDSINTQATYSFPVSTHFHLHFSLIQLILPNFYHNLSLIAYLHFSLIQLIRVENPSCVILLV